jgi:hypothetical protein
VNQPAGSDRPDAGALEGKAIGGAEQHADGEVKHGEAKRGNQKAERLPLQAKELRRPGGEDGEIQTQAGRTSVAASM